MGTFKRKVRGTQGEGTFLDFSFNGLEMSSEISAHLSCLHYDDILHLSYTFNMPFLL